MVTNLDSVIQTTWLNYNGCNIFLIGEKHSPHTQCNSIYVMFHNLVNDTDYPDLLNTAAPKIDLMIEFLQKDAVQDAVHDAIKESQFERLYLKEDNQINNVREYFYNCIVYHNCKLRVHWADPSETIYDDKTKNIDNWLQLLTQILISKLTFDDSWMAHTVITNELQKKDDIIKIITSNPIIVKEINKASEKNPMFTLDFVIDLFKKRFDKYIRLSKAGRWQNYVFHMARCAMDIYTVARIIKLEMQNVIFYGGVNHTTFIIEILSKLHFKTIKVINGEC